MSLRLGLPVAAICGASVLLAPAASPQTVTTPAPATAPVQGLATQPAQSQALALQEGAAQAPVERLRPIKSPPAPGELGKRRTFGLRATLYITTPRDSGKDSIGCRVIPWRTAAVDGRKIRRHTILYIKETVGLRMPDGQVHNGLWYATDVGSAIVPGRIDLYTGKGRRSIVPLLHLNLKTLTVARVGTFSGCPSAAGTTLASNP